MNIRLVGMVNLVAVALVALLAFAQYIPRGQDRDALGQPLTGGANIGVLIDGPEQSWIGWPSTTDIDYIRSKIGASVIRTPICWEYMQPTLGGALNSTYLGQLKTFIGQVHARGGSIIVTVFNDGLYNVAASGDNTFTCANTNYSANQRIIGDF